MPDRVQSASGDPHEISSLLLSPSSESTRFPRASRATRSPLSSLSIHVAHPHSRRIWRRLLTQSGRLPTLNSRSSIPLSLHHSSTPVPAPHTPSIASSELRPRAPNITPPIAKSPDKHLLVASTIRGPSPVALVAFPIAPPSPFTSGRDRAFVEWSL
ncbi:hypothetical protein N7532_006762 [Penicillium argentinense]|uniref:Uncharacterized protein n=1 Tax=Penicillium argentinense TaxID=1131581 RepID=A0A9W9FGJ5_9EURO|nr:uncharacterized protein N7532_006762 [Penicillium argentinense]KAJ5099761.1 hypothetical protein N7532_006762 [Penicillium argentinense]